VIALVTASCSSGSTLTADAGEGSGTASVPAATTPPVTTPPTQPPPICTVTVAPGDSLNAIVARTGLTLEQIEIENSISRDNPIRPGDVYDICVGNDLDDTTGTSRLAPPPDAVIVQQNELNELFGQYSLIPLVVDGKPGGYTRQAICAARMGLRLPVNNGFLTPGSEEEAAIFAATELGIPVGAPTEAAKWILIDKTCQVIFTGEYDQRLVGIYPTSTGQEGFETFNVQAKAFRFDPALDNEGWHDSATFPVEGDNPLNGNMYKPIYFNNGQAIHGAGFIPPAPRSKGCARTYPKHQDAIIEWLGLNERLDATWNVGEIGVTVLVQGRFVARPGDPAPPPPPTTTSPP
jgi:LysM repeat protein